MVNYSMTKEARKYNGEKTISLTCWENLTTTCKKNETRTLSNTIHKNKPKMD